MYVIFQKRIEEQHGALATRIGTFDLELTGQEFEIIDQNNPQIQFVHYRLQALHSLLIRYHQKCK